MIGHRLLFAASALENTIYRNRLIKMAWLIVSNAALKSTRTKVVPCLLFMAVLVALVMYSSAVSVEWFFDTPTESTQPFADKKRASLS